MNIPFIKMTFDFSNTTVAVTDHHPCEAELCFLIAIES